jgi:hypothetical protein
MFVLNLLVFTLRIVYACGTLSVATMSCTSYIIRSSKHKSLSSHIHENTLHLRVIRSIVYCEISGHMRDSP